jgi:putative transposase
MRRKPKTVKVVQRFRISDELWERLEPLLPKPKRRPISQGGRPRTDVRLVADAVFYVLRTGCQWKAIRRETHGLCGSTAHGYFQAWEQAGVFRKFWKAGLHEYDEVAGIQWDFQSMDGATTKAPLGGAPQGQIRPIGPSVVRRDRSRPTQPACQLA